MGHVRRPAGLAAESALGRGGRLQELALAVAAQVDTLVACRAHVYIGEGDVQPLHMQRPL